MKPPSAALPRPAAERSRVRCGHRRLLAAKGVAFEDLSKSLAEDRFYYDTDHLNRAGATALIDGALSELVKRHAKR